MILNCRICETPIQPFMSFGKMPIANGFLNPEDFAMEYFYELKPVFCSNSLTFQIAEQPAQKILTDPQIKFRKITLYLLLKTIELLPKFFIPMHLNSKG